MTYIKFIRRAIRQKQLMPHWRMGQTYFNVLNDVRPDIAELVRGGKDDPYYDDINIGGFLIFVEGKWQNDY